MLVSLPPTFLVRESCLFLAAVPVTPLPQSLATVRCPLKHELHLPRHLPTVCPLLLSRLPPIPEADRLCPMHEPIKVARTLIARLPSSPLFRVLPYLPLPVSTVVTLPLQLRQTRVTPPLDFLPTKLTLDRRPRWWKDKSLPRTAPRRPSRPLVLPPLRPLCPAELEHPLTRARVLRTRPAHPS